jgi:EAL and modified HD-GYP domain-containing signal transduction protein
MLETTLLARQPIYDANLDVHAYELLFRSADQAAAVISDGNAASSTVLLNAFTSLPLADVLDDKPAFVNFTRELLDHDPPVHPSKLVVEILENVEVDADTIAAVRRLRQAGYRIALDDYVYAGHHTELLTLTDIVKIDVLNTRWAVVGALVRRLRPLGVQLLAEKIETQAMFEACRELGFTLFQGYFLAKPQLVRGRQLRTGQQTGLQLMAALRRPGITLREVEGLIRTDAALAFKVLRMVNSAMYNLDKEIDSIQRAAALLGLERLRSMAQLLIMSGLDDKPASLLASTLLRARFGQALAEHAHATGDLDADRQFTAGLLSMLDAHLDMDMADILKDLPISDDLRAVIVHRTGNSGLLLDAAVAFDEASLERIDWQQLSGLGIAADTARDLYLDSLCWVTEIMRAIR